MSGWAVAAGCAGLAVALCSQLTPLLALSAAVLFVVGLSLGRLALQSLPPSACLTHLLPWPWLREEEAEEERRQAEALPAPLTKPRSSSEPNSRPPPWEGLEVPQVLDSALQEFVDLTLKTYVHEWYLEEISTDAAFLVELRHQIRWLAAGLIRRLLGSSLARQGLADWILVKALPLALSHADGYARVRALLASTATQPEVLEQRVLDYHRSSGNLHKALWSRDTELAHLRRLAEYLVKELSDDGRLNGSGVPGGEWAANPQVFLRELVVFAVLLPVLDLLAEPDTLNLLIALLFEPSPMTVYSDPPGPKVAPLAKLSAVPGSDTPDSLVQAKLSDTMHEQDLLFAFMNFIKAQGGPLSQLQFLLAAEDLQERLRKFLHSAEESCGQKAEEEAAAHLHWEAWELYKNYVHEAAPDRLTLPHRLAKELQDVVEGPAEGAAARLEAPLLQAYRLVYGWLQLHWLIPFCQSEAYLSRLAGERPGLPSLESLALSKDTLKAKPLREDGFTMAKFQRKITGVFKSSVEDGIDLLAEAFDWMRDDPARRPVRIRLRSISRRNRTSLEPLLSTTSSSSPPDSPWEPSPPSPGPFLPASAASAPAFLAASALGPLRDPTRLAPPSSNPSSAASSPTEPPPSPKRAKRSWLRSPLQFFGKARVRPEEGGKEGRKASTLPYARLRAEESFHRSATMPRDVAVSGPSASPAAEEAMLALPEGHVLPEDELDPQLAMEIQTNSSGLLASPPCSPLDLLVEASSSGLRDLSRWRVRVPRVEPRREASSGKTHYVYVLHVVPPPSGTSMLAADHAEEQLPPLAACLDEDEGILVDRRYGEWYVLESKLLEFHGQSILSSSLPAKKTFSTKGRAFVESHRAAFEGFLQTLVQRKDLRSSQLLHTFLTSPAELTSAALHEVLNPWKAMKKGAGKLSRERGQNLDGFIKAFMEGAADEAAGKNGRGPASKASSASPADGQSQASGLSGLSALSTQLEAAGQTPRAKLYASAFGNNCGLMVEENVPRVRSGEERSEVIAWGVPKSLYDLLLFCLGRFLSLSSWAFRLLVTLRPVAKRTVDRLVSLFLSYKLNQALHERRQVRPSGCSSR